MGHFNPLTTWDHWDDNLPIHQAKETQIIVTPTDDFNDGFTCDEDCDIFWIILIVSCILWNVWLCVRYGDQYYKNKYAMSFSTGIVERKWSQLHILWDTIRSKRIHFMQCKYHHDVTEEYLPKVVDAVTEHSLPPEIVKLCVMFTGKESYTFYHGPYEHVALVSPECYSSLQENDLISGEFVSMHMVHHPQHYCRRIQSVLIVWLFHAFMVFMSWVMFKGPFWRLPVAIISVISCGLAVIMIIYQLKQCLCCKKRELTVQKAEEMGIITI